MDNSISSEEIILLNNYVMSELRAGLALGNIVFLTKNPKFGEKLVWHCSEEIRHSSIFYQLINKLGIPILNVHLEEKEDYWDYLNKQEDINYRLALLHARELRIPFHFNLHSKVTANIEVKKVLKNLIKEEGPHLIWVRNYLINSMGKEKSMELFKNALLYENKYYKEEIKQFGNVPGSKGKELINLINLQLNNYDNWLLNDYIKKWFT